MNIFNLVILSITQGLTEFLPVSSSGHILIVSNILNYKEFLDPTILITLLHLGTLFALLIHFRKEIINKSTNFNFLSRLFIGIIPIGTIGVLGELFFKQILEKSSYNKTALALTSLGLIVISTIYFVFTPKKYGDKEIEDLTYKQVFLIGISQVFSLFYGISRSGTTILTGLNLKLTKKAAIDFSFLMSIPIVLGSTIFNFQSFDFNRYGFEAIIILLVSFISGLIALKSLYFILQKYSLRVFGVYCFIIAIVNLLIIWL